MRSRHQPSAIFYLMRAAIPGMKARKWGRIITPLPRTAWSRARTSRPMSRPSTASRASPRRSRSKRRRYGITVNCISPGYVWTPLGREPDPGHDEGPRNLTREQVINDVLLAAQPTKDSSHPGASRGARAVPLQRGGEVGHRREPEHGRGLDRRLGFARCASRSLPPSCSPLNGCAQSGATGVVAQPSRDWRAGRNGVRSQAAARVADSLR